MYRNGCLIFRHLFVPGQQLHRNGYRCTIRIQRQRWGKHHPQKLCIHYPSRIQCQTARNSTRCTVPTAPPIPTRHLFSTAFTTTPSSAFRWCRCSCRCEGCRSERRVLPNDCCLQGVVCIVCLSVIALVAVAMILLGVFLFGKSPPHRL